MSDKFDHPEGHTGSGPVSVVIWTTTPWTIPANRAVALNAKIDYSLVQVEQGPNGPERLIVADRFSDCCDGPCWCGALP